MSSLLGMLTNTVAVAYAELSHYCLEVFDPTTKSPEGCFPSGGLYQLLCLEGKSQVIYCAVVAGFGIFPLIISFSTCVTLSLTA